MAVSINPVNCSTLSASVTEVAALASNWVWMELVASRYPSVVVVTLELVRTLEPSVVRILLAVKAETMGAEEKVFVPAIVSSPVSFTFPSRAVCKSVWAERVPVIFPHSVALPPPPIP